MKNTVLAAVLTLLGAFAFSQQRIAVFPFEDLDKILTRNESIMFYREFSNEFTNRSANRFYVVPRQEVEKLFNMEAAFQLSDFSARAKTAEIERVLNGTQILVGAIGRAGSRINVLVSLYTYPEFIQLPGGASLRVADKDELFDKVAEFVQSIQNTIGRVGERSAAQSAALNVTYPANMVRVEGGTFQMGTASGGIGDERPVQTVTVKTFYIGKFEVTQKEWQEITGNNPSYFKGDNLPVENVSWIDAIEYCNKRSQSEGLTPAYRGLGNRITCDWNANGYRLPTEAEWEFAAKGGIKDSFTTDYSGSNNVGTVAWYKDNSDYRTHQVGTRNPNSLGIYDMSGNVWEWCWDWYGNYTGGMQIDPRGALSGNSRVVRGGCWSGPAAFVRSSLRNYISPLYRHNYIGFRVVRP